MVLRMSAVWLVVMMEQSQIHILPAVSVVLLAGYGHAMDKNEIKSEVENSFTLGCFLNAFSSDQIGALKNSAKAKYGSSLWTSLPCGNIFAVSERDCSYFSFILSI